MMTQVWFDIDTGLVYAQNTGTISLNRTGWGRERMILGETREPNRSQIMEDCSGHRMELEFYSICYMKTLV